MALTVKNILDRVQITLQDTTNIRWTQAELLNYLNDAQREIALLKEELSGIKPVIVEKKENKTKKENIEKILTSD